MNQYAGLLATLFFILNAPSHAVGAPLHVVYSDADGRSLLVREEIERDSLKQADVKLTIRLDRPGRRWIGAGAALTDSSSTVLADMNPVVRQQLLQQLFSPEYGNLNVLRLTIGASDFSAHGNYNFSRARGQNDYSYELKAIIPWIKQIAVIQPELTLYGSPWSPPGWMKDSGSMNGGSLLAANYQDYAHYLAGWAHLYQDQHLPLAGLSIQNEPLHNTRDFPSTGLDAAEAIQFIHGYLHPEMQMAGLNNVRILGLDHNWNDWRYAQALAGSAASNDIGGYAFHCYGGNPDDVENLIPALRPDQILLMTECSPLRDSPFADGFRYDMTKLVFGTLKHQGSGIIMWNVILDEKGGPTNGGCTTCEGMATVSAGNSGQRYRFGSSYYALAQVTVAAHPGDRILPVDSSNPAILAVAFEHVNGIASLLVYNSGRQAVTLRSQLNSIDFSYTLPPYRAATFTR